MMTNRRYYDRFIKMTEDLLEVEDFNSLEIKYIEYEFILIKVNNHIQLFEARDTVNAFNFILNNR